MCDCIPCVYPFTQKVAYPDMGPVMLLSESSVKDLSSKLETDVTVERFRPNIVISDCEAFDEVRRLPARSTYFSYFVFPADSSVWLQ